MAEQDLASAEIQPAILSWDDHPVIIIAEAIGPV
jgi:hypothetical protein